MSQPRGRAASPIRVWVNDNTTLIVATGHKARYVGVVGVWRTTSPSALTSFATSWYR